MAPLLEALTLGAGYNAALVTIGAALLGGAAGAAGTFMFLRKRALVSDALAHATLPGIAIAFMVMVAMGGDGRSLPGLLVGSAISAVVGLVAIDLMTRHTRLAQDAAIGAVLSVFFGFGVVCLTAIQTMTAGRQAGLETFLLGSTAGMLYGDALLIAVSAALCVAGVFLLRRPMTIVAFDTAFAQTTGISVRAIDFAMTVLVLAVTVVGLKLVGLVLIVALLIIPPVAARFWTERSERLLWLSAAFGAASGYVGAAMSASAPSLPTGAIIVLTAFSIFAVSILLSPYRGVLAQVVTRRRYAVRVHRRQGLLALAKQEPIYDRMTLAVLGREGLVRPDGVMTEAGEREAVATARDESRWRAATAIFEPSVLPSRADPLAAITALFTEDQLAVIDAHLAGQEGAR